MLLFHSASAFHSHLIQLKSGILPTNPACGYAGKPANRINSFVFHQNKLVVGRSNAATTSLDPWLSEKDVDAIMKEQGPGSLRPNPLVPAERYTSKDWLLCLLTLPTAVEFKRVSSQLLANTLFAIMVWVGYIMHPETVGFLTMGLHPGAHLLLGGALGLLLVFRTNTAYDRFWEGRCLWGFLMSRVREVPHPRTISGSEWRSICRCHP